jgi:hypothetical protein
VAALGVVLLYLLLVSAGPPLAAIWVLWQEVVRPDAGVASVWEYARVGAKIAALAAVWYAAGRFLPPFRWRYRGHGS